MYRKFGLFLFGLMALASLSVNGFAQQKSDEDKLKKMQLEEQLAQPGDEHKKLAELAGSWKTETKYYTKPGAQPMVMTGTSENSIVLGGRFLKIEHRTGGAMPYESLGLFGFDRRYGRYTFVGFDTAGTFYVTASGNVDPATNAIVMSGELGTEKYDFVVRVAGPDKYTLEFIFKKPDSTGGQKEFKAVEVTYSRVH